MTKNIKIILTVIIILILVSTTGLYLNKDNIKVNRELNEDAVFLILVEGEEVASYTMTEIQELEEETFTATLDTSSTDPKKYNYTGVLLKDIIHKAEVDLEDKKLVAVTGADSYTVGLSIDKLSEDDNVYLTYKREGLPLGTREDGGSGPYQLIIRKDQFSQNWCKYAVKADIR